MSTSADSNQKTPELVHPQVRRLHESSGLQSNGKLPANGHASRSESQSASRVPTPVPADAPPSVRATSSARKALRAQDRRSLFPTVDYVPRVSHFDPRSEYRDFRGFFVLFWIGLAIMVITTMLRNLKETGSVFPFRQRDIFLENIWELAFSDATMTASTALCLPLHKLYANSEGGLRWTKGGVWIQSTFQAIWLAYWIQWPFLRSWTWTAQVFFTLHLLSLFMKMHSYAFYNGHLSETLRRLNALDSPTTANEVFTKSAAIQYPTTANRRHSIQPESIPDDDEDQPDHSTADADRKLHQLREDLAVELTSPLGHVTYPTNLTLLNFGDFLCCPTLCYELEYPRTAGINYLELFYKTLATFGCIFLLTVTSEEFIIPVLDESAERMQESKKLTDRGLILAETTSRLLFPFMITFLLVFLVIFEYLCGAFAELTCFADRHFYSDWWNSCDWLEFSREWNIPVHNFFRRHVYAALAPSSPSSSHTRPSSSKSPNSPKSPHSSSTSPTSAHCRKPSGTASVPSASSSGVSRPLATFITFLISSLAHELVMGCITKKLRGYGAVAMMMQMPIVLLQRSRWVRGRTLLNNIVFWCSMVLGLSAMCSLYVLV